MSKPPIYKEGDLLTDAGGILWTVVGVANQDRKTVIHTLNSQHGDVRHVVGSTILLFTKGTP